MLDILMISLILTPFVILIGYIRALDTSMSAKQQEGNASVQTETSDDILASHDCKRK